MIRHLLFPRRCPGCNELLKENEIKIGFCRECRSMLIPAAGHICEKCGKILTTPGGTLCIDCKKGLHSFDEARALYLYEEPIKTAMYRYKYSNMRTYTKSFLDEGLDRVLPWIREKDPEIIIPVPMYKGKERRRGYNQAAVFGEELSKRISVPVRSDLLTRETDTVPLKGLDPEERRNNLKNAFKIGGNVVQLSRILIVDDILTTGATVDTLSHALKDAGVRYIYCLSLCTGRSADTL